LVVGGWWLGVVRCLPNPMSSHSAACGSFAIGLCACHVCGCLPPPPPPPTDGQVPLLSARLRSATSVTDLDGFMNADFKGEGDGLDLYRSLAGGLEAILCLLQVPGTRFCRFSVG
jgi:hypothetical protein